MDRRTFIGALTGGLLAGPLVVEAQQTRRVYRIGILMNKASDPAESRQWQVFRLGLRERGWIEGDSILIELRARFGLLAGTREGGGARGALRLARPRGGRWARPRTGQPV